MKLKQLLSILVLTTLLTSFKLGSSTAFLKCKSDSGRTEFYAELQDISGILEKAVLKVDSSTLEYKTENGHIIFDPVNGILTMYIDDYKNKGDLQHKYLEFWSIPSTFKIIKNQREHQIYEFQAKIHGTEPRKNRHNHIPTITLNCRLEYQI